MKWNEGTDFFSFAPRQGNSQLLLVLSSRLSWKHIIWHPELGHGNKCKNAFASWRLGQDSSSRV